MGADLEELSSKDFACGPFAAHGEFRVRVEDGLVRWENHGPFNAEAMQQYALLRRAAYERWDLDRRRSVAVVHWHGSALMSPEAFDGYCLAFESFFQGRPPWGAVAWVAAPGLEGMEFMLKRFARLFEQHGLPFGRFEQVDEALRWARQHAGLAGSG